MNIREIMIDWCANSWVDENSPDVEHHKRGLEHYSEYSDTELLTEIIEISFLAGQKSVEK